MEKKKIRKTERKRNGDENGGRVKEDREGKKPEGRGRMEERRRKDRQREDIDHATPPGRKKQEQDKGKHEEKNDIENNTHRRTCLKPKVGIN